MTTAISNVAMMVGLSYLPLIAQFSIDQAGWREAWLVVGATVLLVGLLPVWLLVARRPEDLGLKIDGEIVEVNDALADNPGMVNEDPTGAAWFFKMKVEDMSQLDELMSEDDYKDFIG